jgi:TATA-box binding protein (TBP) (component of TFIID and TFIIIB)
MDYKISTITQTCYINQLINLYDLGKYLQIDQDIVGYKYNFNNNMIIKGIFKSKSTTNNFFNNQLTVKLRHPLNNRIINVKIFNNGTFHFTGCTLTNDGELLTNFLIDKINNIKCNQEILLEKDENGIYIDKKTNIIYNTFFYSFGIKTENKYVINNIAYDFHIQKQFFINAKITKKRTILDTNGNIIGSCDILMSKGSKLFMNNNIIIDLNKQKIFYNEKEIGNILFNITSSSITRDNLESTHLLKYKIKSIENYHINTITNCINVCFNVNTIINRLKLTEYLKNNNYIASYDPEIYSGVKLAFRQNKYNNGICYCNLKCICNTVTFLIFESGNIITTNFKEIDSINHTINFFMKLIKTFETKC